MFLFVYNFKPINIMKKLLLIIFFLAGTILQAQIKKGLSVSISYGITNPIQDYRQYQFADDSIGFPGAELFPTYGYALKRKGGKQFNIDASYRFGAFGMGLSFGQLSHQIESFDYNIDFPHQFNGGDFSATYYGVGPDYSLSMGKLDLTSSIRAGMMKSEITKMYVDYTGNDFNEPVRLLTTTPVEEKGSSLAYASVGIKLSYPFGKHLSLFVKSDLFTSLGKGIEVKDVYYQPFDVDRNEDINAFDVEHFKIEEFKQEDQRFIKPQMFNVGVGVTYTLNGIGKKTKTTSQNRTRNDKIKDFFAKKRIANPDTQPTKIVLISPKDGQHYKDGKMPKVLKWQVVGKAFKNPVYIIEMMDANSKIVKTAKSKDTQIAAQKLFATDKPSGHYIWRVTEQGSGIGGGPASLYFDNCDFTMTVDNVNIECKGYEGSDRKYEICFDVTYVSTTGDLTYTNSGSGLMVYDQNYTNLSYNLTGSNTSLQTQTGATQSTVHYCFETTVDNNVTSIGFGLQGDDLDPSPAVTCQPGASNGIDDLPDCLCDECDRIQINADDFNIQQDSSNGSFNFDGNINVSVPIYGIEFQVISMNYSSNPGTCSQGVTGVETSGVFLSGTTVNGSNNIQFYNESSSPAGSGSNNNASKDIKYMSSSPMTGNIPVHLNMGLPQPLAGLNSGCCEINYTVCLRIKVFYEDGTCKTCSINKCFNFNNQ